MKEKKMVINCKAGNANILRKNLHSDIVVVFGCIEMVLKKWHIEIKPNKKAILNLIEKIEKDKIKDPVFDALLERITEKIEFVNNTLNGHVEAISSNTILSLGDITERDTPSPSQEEVEKFLDEHSFQYTKPPKKVDYSSIGNNLKKFSSKNDLVKAIKDLKGNTQEVIEQYFIEMLESNIGLIEDLIDDENHIEKNSDIYKNANKIINKFKKYNNLIINQSKLLKGSTNVPSFIVGALKYGEGFENIKKTKERREAVRESSKPDELLEGAQYYEKGLENLEKTSGGIEALKKTKKPLDLLKGAQYYKEELKIFENTSGGMEALGRTNKPIGMLSKADQDPDKIKRLTEEEMIMFSEYEYPKLF